MELKLVNVPGLKQPIQPSPGFAKKLLSDYKLDLCALCGFGCRYCSSNNGFYLRTHRKPFMEAARQQLGQALTPADDPGLMYVWDNVLEQLEAQLAGRRNAKWGRGKTLVFSMLTDGFSPYLVREGITQAALEMVLKRTAFRIRVLTKNAVVGHDQWVQFFKAHPGRFVVGLSVGTTDDHWAKTVEIGTSVPSARLDALQRLQKAGVPTFGMLCPIFPDVVACSGLDRLVDAIGPSVVEKVWAEPFNDRQNWRYVRDGYAPRSAGWEWLTQVYDNDPPTRDLWSAYATDLYARLSEKARREGWLPKLCFLLYEDQISREHAGSYRGLEGACLQSKPRPDGKSPNPWIAALQAQPVGPAGSVARHR
jgi:DNA repair photolyase